MRRTFHFKFQPLEVLKNLLPSLLAFSFTVVALKATPSGEIYRKIEKLNSTGSVLYFAAHPDDENTALLYHMSHELKLDTAYMSLTRGDGGQNRIGPELGKELGFIRTQELLGARTYDWTQQFFSRAVDFGYSKTVKDTLVHWDEQKVLADTVYVIRKFKPDLIITRFHPDRGDTHGHHTASAIIALQAFEMAADPNAFPEQLSDVDVHQTKQMVWDSYRRRGEAVPEDALVRVSLENYDEILGGSTMEFSRKALAFNKSQGTVFATNRRNRNVNLQWLAGEPIEDFSVLGLTEGWSTVEGGAPIGDHLARIAATFDFQNPSRSLEGMLEVKRMIESLEPSALKERKHDQVNEIIADLLGLFIEVRTSQESVTPGKDLPVTIEWVNRSNAALLAKSVDFSMSDHASYPERHHFASTDASQMLTKNQPLYRELTLSIPREAKYTQPYWIENGAGANGSFQFENHKLLFEADSPPTIMAHFHFELGGQSLSLDAPVIHHQTDLFRGEVKTPVSVVPLVSIRFMSEMILFPNEQPQRFEIELKANEDLSGDLVFEVDEGWRLDWTEDSVNLKAGEVQRFTGILHYIPSGNDTVGNIRVKWVVDGKEFSKEIRRITYPHIETQAWLADAELKVVKVDLKTDSGKIAYVHGVGDEIPEVLRKIGYTVDELGVDDLATDDLSSYQAVVFGIRVFDVQAGIDRVIPKLEAYVENGGTWLVQYVRNQSAFQSPVPLTLSRQRVSEELAEVTILATEHPMLNYPNKISTADFEDWVQERGLYFASEWDDQFTALLSCHDEGEPAREGGLIVAPVGEGHYIYSGYSFFRQLPAGVPGAIRLFVNLISNQEN